MTSLLKEPKSLIIANLSRLLIIAALASIIMAGSATISVAVDLPASTFLPFNNKQTQDFGVTERYIYQSSQDYIYFTYKEDIMTGERHIAAQKLDKDGKEIWKKTYNLKGQSTLQVVHILKGGFVMAVSCQEAERSVIWLLCIDSSGKITWQRELPLKAVNSIASTNDDGLVIAGTIGEANQDIKIIKMDKTGIWKGEEKKASRWEKTYTNPGNQQANQIIQMLDKEGYNDGYILTGYTDNNTKGKQDVYLVRLNAYGEVKWEKNYGDKDDEQGITVGVAINSSDEHIGFLVAGNSINSKGEGKMYLIYVDKYGWNQSWPGYQVAVDGAKVRQFGDLSLNMSMTLVPVPDAFKSSRKLRGESIEGNGGVVLVGYSPDNESILVIRINEYGHVIWKRQLSVPGDNLIMGTLTKGTSKEQIIAYSSTYPDNQWGDMEFYTLKLYLEGTVDQDKTIPKDAQLESNSEGVAWEKSSLKYEAMRDISKEIKDLLHQQPYQPRTSVITGGGEIEWPDNSYYLGNLVIGKADGEGTLFFTNGVWYKGAWKNNMFYGNGLLRFPTGEYYEGEFNEHMMQGKGVFRWPTGEKYEGEFKYNQRSGQGKLTWANGTYYEGGFEDNNAHGNGAIYWPNGERYEGQMKSGSATGQGSYYFPTGERYRGEFSNLTFQGVGVYHWPDGSYYVGEFKQDRFNGEGYYVWPNGVMQHGYWKDDRYLGTNPEAEKSRSKW